VNFHEELGQLPPDLELGTTPDELMRRGRRIRRIRQSSVAGVAAIAVFGITATGVAFAGRHSTQVVHPASGGVGLSLTSPSPIPATTSAASASSVSTSSCFPKPQATTGAPPAPLNFDLSPNPQPWGSLINVGTDSNGKHVVMYGYHIDDAVLPCTHFGLMLGTKDLSTGATSGVTGMYGTNDLSGSDLTPGMHAISLSGGGNQITAWYLIGYYVGPAAAVSVDEKASASPIAATVVPWSVNPDVKFWWVSGTGAVPTVGQLHATDANGTALPIGLHGQVGVS
jgi:hypothetical protein